MVMEASNAGFVEAWKRAGPMLDQVRREESRNVDLAVELARLADAFKIALRTR